MKVHKHSRGCTCSVWLVKVHFVAGRTDGTWSSHSVLLELPLCWYEIEDALLAKAMQSTELGEDVCFTHLLHYHDLAATSTN